MADDAYDRLSQTLMSSFSPGDQGEVADASTDVRTVSVGEENSNPITWTTFFLGLGGLGELLSKAVSNGYWGVDLAHLIYEPKDENDPAHYVIYAVAGVFALTAGGAAYLHWLLNGAHSHSGHDHKQKKASGPVSAPHSSINFQVLREGEGEVEPETKSGPTKMQWVALVTDYITHIGETSGPLTYGFDQLTASQGVQLPEWVRPVSILLLTLFSSLTAVADVRTCYHAMMGHSDEHDHEHAHHHDDHNHTEADIWTKLNFYGEAASGVVSNPAWGMDIVFLIYNLTCQTQDEGNTHYPPLFNVMLYLVVCFFAATALASAKIHKDLNIIHQHGDEPETKEEDRLPLTTSQKVKLALDAVTHTGNVASPLSNQGYDQLAANVIKTPLPGWVNPAVKAGTLVFGMFAAVPYVRTCKDAMETKNKRDDDERNKQPAHVRPVTRVLPRNSINR